MTRVSDNEESRDVEEGKSMRSHSVCHTRSRSNSISDFEVRARSGACEKDQTIIFTLREHE